MDNNSDSNSKSSYKFDQLSLQEVIINTYISILRGINVSGKNIIESLPFTDIDLTKLHVTFLSNKCSNPPIDQIMDKKNVSELVHISEEAVYIYCPDGYGKTKLNNNFLEKKLEVSATTRNWKTVNKLCTLASENN